MSDDTDQLLFRQSPLPMWVYDAASLAILDANDAAGSLYGYSRAEFVHLTLLNLCPVQDRTTLLAFLAKAKGDSQRPRSSVWRQCKRDGSIITVEVNAVWITFQGKRAGLVINRQLDEAKQSYASLSTPELIKVIERQQQQISTLEDFLTKILKDRPLGHA